MTIESGRFAGRDFVAPGMAIFSRTKALLPMRSTRQQSIGSSAGARNASPVRRLKQA